MTQQCSPDIVGRLRDRDAVVMSGLFHAIPTMREVADEIERLRAVIADAQLVRSQPLRDQFERWAEADHRAIEPEQFEDHSDDNNQYYQDDSDNSAFIGWKAALSSAQCGDAFPQTQQHREAKP